MNILLYINDKLMSRGSIKEIFAFVLLGKYFVLLQITVNYSLNNFKSFSTQLNFNTMKPIEYCAAIIPQDLLPFTF